MGLQAIHLQYAQWKPHILKQYLKMIRSIKPNESTTDSSNSVKINFRIKKSDWPNTQELNETWKRWGFCYVEPKENKVYFRFSLGLFRFRLMLGNLHTSKPTYEISPLYWKLSFNIGTALSPFYVHLRDIITMNLIKTNTLTIHGSCLCSSKGEACLIIAPPETGKTITALLGQKEGYGLLSEDLVVSDGTNIIPSLVDGQKVYSPAYLSTQKGFQPSIQRLLTKTIEKSGVAWPGLLAHIGGTIVPTPYDKPARLKYIFFLAKGTNSNITSVNRKDALMKMKIIDRGEFHWRSNPVLLAYDYHTLLLDLPSLQEKEDNLITKIIDNSDGIFQIKATNPHEYIKLVKDVFPM